MKASAFTYHRPFDRSEALEMLGFFESAKLIAGGQSLVAMLNMRYAAFDNLIDINHIADLAGVTVEPRRIRIGAMTRQCDLYADPMVRAVAPVVAGALRHVGHLHTRNRGTMGGSLCHMDPAAELMGVSALLDATVHVEGPSGARDIAFPDFPQSYMQPAIESGEMVVAVTLQPPPQGHGWSFQEFAQRHGDFAVVAAAATLALDAEGRIADARVVLCGTRFAPMRLSEGERLLAGQTPTAELFADVAALAGRQEADSDAHVSGAYRQRLARIYIRRALDEALERATQGAAV